MHIADIQIYSPTWKKKKKKTKLYEKYLTEEEIESSKVFIRESNIYTGDPYSNKA